MLFALKLKYLKILYLMTQRQHYINNYICAIPQRHLIKSLIQIRIFIYWANYDKE